MSKTKNTSEVFNLSITGNGINIDRDIDQTILAQIMSIIMGNPVAIVQSKMKSSTQELSRQTSQTPISLREHLDQVKARRKPDQIVAIGHYISQYQNQVEFSRSKIQSHFSQAREPMPSNFSRDFGIAIKAGRIAEVHKKPGLFYITKTGVSAVERHFAKDK